MTTQTSSALISAETLSSWIDSGVVNSSAGFDRVVILDMAGTVADYNLGHIPGALYVDYNTIVPTRREGPAATTNEPMTGAAMDALIQKYGINKNTTIVFTAKSALTNATRAYFTFRYWGFPKERLKVLDGQNSGWTAAGYSLTTDLTPLPAPSTYSVRNNAQLRTDLRTSLSEMINVAENGGLSVDVRSPETGASSYAGTRGKTTGLFNPGSDYVAFEGRVKGARAFNGGTLLTGVMYKSAADLVAVFSAIGVDSTKLTHVY